MDQTQQFQFHHAAIVAVDMLLAGATSVVIHPKHTGYIVSHSGALAPAPDERPWDYLHGAAAYLQGNYAVSVSRGEDVVLSSSDLPEPDELITDPDYAFDMFPHLASSCTNPTFH